MRDSIIIILEAICILFLCIKVDDLKGSIKTKNTIIVHQTKLIDKLDSLNRHNENYPAELYEDDLENIDYFDMFSIIDSLKYSNSNKKYTDYEHI